MSVDLSPASPDQPAKKFAFLAHPRADVAADMGRVWSPLGRIPSAAWDWGLRRLPVPPQRGSHCAPASPCARQACTASAAVARAPAST